jgi:hypothetical protein
MVVNARAPVHTAKEFSKLVTIRNFSVIVLAGFVKKYDNPMCHVRTNSTHHTLSYQHGMENIKKDKSVKQTNYNISLQLFNFMNCGTPLVELYNTNNNTNTITITTQYSNLY